MIDILLHHAPVVLAIIVVGCGGAVAIMWSTRGHGRRVRPVTVPKQPSRNVTGAGRHAP